MSSTSAKRKVLVVDDSSDITVTIKTGLEDSGLFHVDIFNDPKLALSSFKPGLYDLILIDFKMPKMYGHVLYDEIKKMDNKVKVCFLTATYSDYEAARKIFPMLEIECYIQKPVGIEDLVKRINKELGQ
jgi:DNA-binding response OmpR family regulator